MDYEQARAIFIPPLPTERPPARLPDTPARRLRDAAEPIATISFWGRFVQQRFVELGLNFGTGYVWARAAPMGEVSAPVVVATFGVFEPGDLTARYETTATTCRRALTPRGPRVCLGRHDGQQEAAVNQTIVRLRDAMNRHDPEAMASLFAPDYRSEQPLHPRRGFGGREQVAANWRQMFDGVPDLQVGVVKESTDGTTSWSEWVWRGSHSDGSPFLMKGVIVMGLRDDGLIAWARLYMGPVEQGGAAIEEAVRHLSGSAP